jgi:hypothetical protein
MKYKVSKISPMPGEFTDLTVKTLSSVKSPANQQKYLVMKGNNSEMLTEQDRKDLQAQGLHPETISKAADTLPPEEKDTAVKGFMSIFKGIFGGKQDPAKAEPLTLEAIQKAVEKTIDEKLSVLKNTDATLPVDDAAELARIQKEIDDEAVKQSQVNDISKQLEIKKQELAEAKAKTEEIIKMRVPGNAGFQANEQQATLSAEEAEISKRHEPFKGTALDFSSLRIG